MPWYKFQADHGPGHQSTTTTYRHFEERLTEADKRAEWDDWVDDSRFNESSVGGVTQVDALPVKVHTEHVAMNKRQVSNAQAKLKILLNTPVQDG